MKTLGVGSHCFFTLLAVAHCLQVGDLESLFLVWVSSPQSLTFYMLSILQMRLVHLLFRPDALATAGRTGTFQQ